MTVRQLELTEELKKVLWVCYKSWESQNLPPSERRINYSNIIDLYQETFGSRFHQAQLYQLTKLGFLRQDSLVRAGHRRYYELVNPEAVREFLMQRELHASKNRKLSGTATLNGFLVTSTSVI